MTHLTLQVNTESDLTALEAQGMVFNPQRDYVACAICGAIYQHFLSRLPEHEITAEGILQAQLARMAWSRKHARTHLQKEHDDLAASGRKMTPEAALRLSTYGIIAYTDGLYSDEHNAAMREAPRKPVNDVEGT